MQNEYIEKLEGIIKQMLQPLKGIPLKLVIPALSGYKIVPFNHNDDKDIDLLNTLKIVAQNSAKSFNAIEVLRSRPNEIGNDIEPFVKKVLEENGLRAGTPNTIKGKKKSTGYPDIEFEDKFGRINYLECKTYNIENISTTQRSFYLSPSEDFKITKDAHHFVISFEIYVKENRGVNHLYKCNSWKIIALENLEVDVKYEFNSDNKRLYAQNLILAEGKL